MPDWPGAQYACQKNRRRRREMIVKIVIKTFATVLSCLVLAGCVDLPAVRDYAAAASSLVSEKKLAQRFRDSNKRLEALKGPDDTDSPALGGRSRDDAYKDIAAIHDALGAYFAAASALAADGLVDLSAPTGQLTGAIKNVYPEFSDDDQRAFTSVVKLLQIPLDMYRRDRLRDMLIGSDEEIGRLLAVLEQLTRVYTRDLQLENDSITGWMKAKARGSGDAGIKFLVSQHIQEKTAPVREAREAIQTYQQALAQIQQRHRDLQKALVLGGPLLESTLKQLKATRLQLIDARDAVRAAR